MTLTRQQLMRDLYVAFYDARRHKSKRSYVLKWERDLKENMDVLCNELFSRCYQPLHSKCFIIDYPKKREVFAAMFRDRIVHHLYFNYTHEMFERTFIADDCSCIKGRGTHYGIKRVEAFCRKESMNWQRKCYGLHLDIRGYFMHIDRSRLLVIATDSLRKMSMHKVSKCSELTWNDVRDMDFVVWLTKVITTIDPRKNCVMVGDPSDWNGLDPAKSMLKLKDGLGLPIGNLTSQLFSNVYLNVLDQYVKRELHCRYYGRYVDDAIIVCHDREFLRNLVPKIQDFMQQKLGLELHRGKLEISDVDKGVEFLGAYIKPWRTYTSRRTVERIERKLKCYDFRCPPKTLRTVNSYLGIFSHTASYGVRRRMFLKEEFLKVGRFNENMTKIIDRREYNY